jgi:hypothetical protein
MVGVGHLLSLSIVRAAAMDVGPVLSGRAPSTCDDVNPQFSLVYRRTPRS